MIKNNISNTDSNKLIYNNKSNGNDNDDKNDAQSNDNKKYSKIRVYVNDHF